MALSYKENRIVTMLSTYHNTEIEYVPQIIRGGRRIVIKKPKIILDYIQNMGGIDTLDQYCGSCSFTRKSVKRWQKLFFWTLEVNILVYL